MWLYYHRTLLVDTHGLNCTCSPLLLSICLRACVEFAPAAWTVGKITVHVLALLVLLACAAPASAWHGPATQRNTERDQLSRSTRRSWMGTGTHNSPMCVRQARRTKLISTAVRCTEVQRASALQHSAIWSPGRGA